MKTYFCHVSAGAFAPDDFRESVYLPYGMYLYMVCNVNKSSLSSEFLENVLELLYSAYVIIYHGFEFIKF